MNAAMLTVRLSSNLQNDLEGYCQREKVSKSVVVKEALEHYFNEKRFNDNPYSVGEDLFGAEGSGVSEASVSYKKKIKQHLNEKHSH